MFPDDVALGSNVKEGVKRMAKRTMFERSHTKVRFSNEDMD